MFMARIPVSISGHDAQDHFPSIRKMVDVGSGAKREIDDFMLIAGFSGRFFGEWEDFWFHWTFMRKVY